MPTVAIRTNWPRLHREMALVKNLFLRFYAANLSRTRRNDPQRACGDAILQMAAVGGVGSTSIYIIAGLVISKALLRHMYAVDPVYLIVSGGFGALMGLFASRSFRRYKEMPEAAGPYRSRSAVRVLNVLYVAIPIAWAWLIGLALHFLDAAG
jgi:hypothetical protein